jgi:hypothetical protein
MNGVYLAHDGTYHVCVQLASDKRTNVPKACRHRTVRDALGHAQNPSPLRATRATDEAASAYLADGEDSRRSLGSPAASRPSGSREGNPAPQGFGL